MKKMMLFILCFAMIFSLQILEKKEIVTSENSWQKMSEFKTDYSFSTKERKHNVELAASRLNGTILNSGQTLSFNSTVGKRIEQNGYKTAVVIENGVYTGGVGGGVCQVSTTVYNAAIRAGINILEVHPHTLSPDYIDASFDAMVSDSGSDLVLKNVYSFPIKILAKADNGILTVKILGTKKISGLEIIPYNSVVKTIKPAETITKPDTEYEDIEVDFGKIIPYRNSKCGKVSKGYIMYKYMGKVIRIKQVRSDLYIPMQGVNIVGTKVPDVYEIKEVE